MFTLNNVDAIYKRYTCLLHSKIIMSMRGNVGKVNKYEFKTGFLNEIEPILALQFDEVKNNISAKEIFISTFYDERSFYWKCPNCNKSWLTSIYSRLKNRTAWSKGMCGSCYTGLSFAQIAIQVHYEKLLKPLISEIIIKTEKYNNFEIDIVVIIPTFAILFGIEYDSEYFHKNRADFDKLKNQNISQKYRVIRFREEGLDSLNDNLCIEITTPRYPTVQLEQFDEAIRESFKYFVDYLLENAHEGHVVEVKKIANQIMSKAAEINTFSIASEIYERLPEVPLQKRIRTVAPSLELEYSSLNKISIEKTNAHTNEYRLWECLLNEDHKAEPYLATVNARTKAYKLAQKEGREYNGCPYCSGRSTIKSESLKFLFPEISELLELGISLHGTEKEKTIDFFKVPLSSSRKLPIACKICGFGVENLELDSPYNLSLRAYNIQKGIGKNMYICKGCSAKVILDEGALFYSLRSEGSPFSDIAYNYNTSIKKVKKLINNYLKDS